MSLAELFYAKHPRGPRLTHPRRRRALLRRRTLLFEPLEPRLLLDALPLPLTIDMPPLQADLTVRLDEGGQNVQVVEAKTASVVAEQPLSNTSEVVVRGTAGDDRLTIDASVPASLPIRFSGGPGTDTLVGPNTDSAWVVTWPDEGHVGSVAFSEVEHLVGAPDNWDTFILAAGGSLSGSIEGGAGGFDALVIDDRAGAKVTSEATGPDSGSIDLDGTVLLYSGLESIPDLTAMADGIEPLEPRLLLDALPLPLTVDMPPLQADLTVRLDDGGQNVQVVEAKTASVVAEQPLSNTSEVVVRGTAGDDRLTIDASVPASLPIRFSGGLGADTLVGPNTDSTWVVTWPDEGHVGSVAFSEVEHLVGAPDNEAS